MIDLAVLQMKASIFSRFRLVSAGRRAKPLLAFLYLAVVSAAALLVPPVIAETPAGRPAAVGSGLPVPRFVSLKSDRVNLRNGPGTDYPTGWVYRRAGLPLEVVKEFEGWRQVRDAEGVNGMGAAVVPLRPPYRPRAALGAQSRGAASARAHSGERQRRTPTSSPTSKPAS